MIKHLIYLFMLIVLCLAQEEEIIVKTPLTKKLKDFNVSVGIVSIEELKNSFPRAYAHLEKHSGVPQRYDTHYLAVALWKKEGDKIVYLSDYKVEAEVRSPILRAQRKELHRYPHQHGENFGSWFQMEDKGLYSINLYIKDEKGKIWKVKFDYMLQ